MRFNNEMEGFVRQATIMINPCTFELNMLALHAVSKIAPPPPINPKPCNIIGYYRGLNN